MRKLNVLLICIGFYSVCLGQIGQKKIILEVASPVTFFSKNTIPTLYSQMGLELFLGRRFALQGCVSMGTMRSAREEDIAKSGDFRNEFKFLNVNISRNFFKEKYRGRLNRNMLLLGLGPAYMRSDIKYYINAENLERSKYDIFLLNVKAEYRYILSARLMFVTSCDLLLSNSPLLDGDAQNNAKDHFASIGAGLIINIENGVRYRGYRLKIPPFR